MHQNNASLKKQLIYGSFICLIAALFYCYEFILRILPGVLHSELSAAFGHVSASVFGQISALYYVAYSPMQLPVGMLMDRFGPRRLLSLACLCCTLGSFLFGFSSSLSLISLGRFLVGFGSSFAFVGVLSLALHWLPRHYFSFVAGLMTTLGMFGLVYGELNITRLAMTMGLPYVLSLTVILGLVLMVFIFLMVRDTPARQPQHTTQHLRDFFKDVVRVLISPKVWLIGFIGACLYTSLSVFGELWGKAYLEQAHHLSKYDAAKAISAMFIGWGVGAPIAGYLSDKTGRRAALLLVSAILSLLCISMVLYYPGLTYRSIVILMVLYGLFSSTEITVFIMAKEITGTRISGTVFAATNMIVSFVGMIFQPLVGKLLDLYGSHLVINGEHVYLATDYQIALSVIPISFVLFFVAMLILYRLGLQQTPVQRPR